MVDGDLHKILAGHRSRIKERSEISTKSSPGQSVPTISEIPDLFFDRILVEFKLTRMDVMVLMYLYRRVWCRPNLYKVYGISQLMSLTEMAKSLGIAIEDIYNSLRKLEEFGFISTVRSGQYFVRKYFLKELDEHYGQTYDDFEV